MSKQVDDPFSNSTCPGYDILSYGSYIYNAPSKYDGVYWPATDERWLWLCPKSGYASLGSDFNDLTDAERRRVQEYLSKHYDPKHPPPDALGRLALMEQLYRRRDKDDEFWSWFYRLVAYWNDTLGRTESAQGYRKKALPLLERRAAALPAGLEKIEHLFLAGEYHRRLGNLGLAKEYFRQAIEVRWIDEDGKSQVGHQHFNELIRERRAMMP
jgi:tetratricopeptide (TPR) repeat protein